MDISYSFKVTNIYCYPTYQSLENLVFTVIWDFIGSDGTYSSNVLGSTEIPYDSNAEYTPYQNLTEQEVISWIEQYIDPETLQNAKDLITSRIEEASRPPAIINPKLPWDL